MNMNMNVMKAAVLGKMGITELLLILLVVLIIFGPKQLPKLAKTFGKTINSFKKGIEDGLDDEEDEVKKGSDNDKAEKKAKPEEKE